MSHLAREFTQSSISIWPQFVQTVQQYFNVTHGYVLRKILWQLVPLQSIKKKKFGDGDLATGHKDWTVRSFHGIEMELEEPDLYIPTMGFITYIVLCGVVRGIQEQFSSDTLSATMSFAVAALVLETTTTKIALFMTGAVNASTMDLVAVLGYKFFYLSLQLLIGLILGLGGRPGFFHTVLSLCLHASCAVALWQALQRLARTQASVGQDYLPDMHKLIIKAVPLLQLVVCYILLPSWPKSGGIGTQSWGSDQLTAASISAIAATTTSFIAVEVSANAVAVAEAAIPAS